MRRMTRFEVIWGEGKRALESNLWMLLTYHYHSPSLRGWGKLERQGQTREEASGVWTGEPNMWPEFLSTKSSLLSITNQSQMHLSSEQGWAAAAASAEASSYICSTPLLQDLFPRRPNDLLVVRNESLDTKSLQNITLSCWKRQVSIWSGIVFPQWDAAGTAGQGISQTVLSPQHLEFGPSQPEGTKTGKGMLCPWSTSQVSICGNLVWKNEGSKLELLFLREPSYQSGFSSGW